MSVNKTILVGNVGKAPEVREVGASKVATFSLATTEKGYTAKDGTVIQDRTTWHNIVAWKGLAEIVEKYVNKGSQIFIEGKYTSRLWEKDGVKHTSYEVIAENIQLLGKAEKSESGYASKPDGDDCPF